MHGKAMLSGGTALWPIPIAALIQAKRFPDVTAVPDQSPDIGSDNFLPVNRILPRPL